MGGGGGEPLTHGSYHMITRRSLCRVQGHILSPCEKFLLK